MILDSKKLKNRKLKKAIFALSLLIFAAGITFLWSFIFQSDAAGAAKKSKIIFQEARQWQIAADSPGSTLTLRPNAAGDATNLDNLVGASTHWEAVDEDPSDNDITYVGNLAKSTTQYDLYNLQNHNTESGTINSVTVYINVKETTGKAATAATVIKTEGTEFRGTANTMTPDATTYSTYSTPYTTNPSTGVAWTWTEVDSLQAGVELAETGGDNNSDLRATQVWAVVDYNPPPSPTLDQNHYRWRDDSTALNTSGGWLAAEDTAATTTGIDSVFRLRAEIANTGSAQATGTQYQLEYAVKNGATCGDDETFAAVPTTTASAPFVMATSTQYADGASTTVSFLTGVGTFATGTAVEYPSNKTSAYDLTNGYYTEFEYALKATTNATSSYCFRLTNNGTTTNFTYSAYPELEIRFDFSVTSTDISFSDDTPPAGGNITVTAVIHNSGKNYDSTPVLTDQYYDTSNGASVDSNYVVNSGEYLAEEFNPNATFTVAKIQLYMRAVGTCGTLTIHIREDSGGLPTGATLATTTRTTCTPTSNDWIDFVFDNYPTLNNGTNYWIVAKGTGADNSNCWSWATDDTDPTWSGDFAADTDGGTENWSVYSGYDSLFRVYKSDGAPIDVNFFDGDPDSGGTQIGSTSTIASLASGATTTATTSWTTTAGSHNIYVVIDKAGKITESNENNNKAYKAINVLGFTQSSYRWYDNTDSVQPSSAKAAENTEITDIATSTILRLRTSVQISDGDLAADSTAFKLQYAQMQGSACGGGDESWSDVGSTSSAEIWRGYDNSDTSDGGQITSSLLDSQDNALESYEEENPSVNNPAAISSGSKGEWDWVIQNNGASDGTPYCFRMVKSSGAVFGTYTNYPKLTTSNQLDEVHYRWRNDDGGERDISIGEKWNEKTSGANWSNRSELEAPTSAYDSKMWIMGGTTASDVFANDVWYSTDGEIWTQVLATDNGTYWEKRALANAYIYSDRMWIAAGRKAGNISFNDVWWTTDGAVWTEATAGANWPASRGGAGLVYSDRMWLMGGIESGGTTRYNDVWWTTDGAVWTNIGATNHWEARAGLGGVIYDGKMWIMGGENGTSSLNDVWWTTDGSVWTRATTGANWSARSGIEALAIDGKMWAIGGGGTNEVWYSTDGVDWTQTTNVGWEARSSFTSAIYENKMWVMGGGNYQYNDVWYSASSSAATWKQLEDVAHTNQAKDANVRVRFSIDNPASSTAALNYRLQVAAKGDKPDCESVESSSFSDVPTTSGGCGTAVACMSTSANFDDGDATTKQLSTTTGHTFTAGKMVEDPSNQTGGITLDNNRFTEAEYNFQFTDYAAASTTYCFRVSSAGTALNTYSKVATISTEPGSVFTQNDWRWYENADSVQPGATTTAAENQTTTNVATNDILRARMNLLVESVALPTSTDAFKLQYASTTGACTSTLNWYDVNPANWYNNDWGYRKKIPITGVSGAGTDYPVQIKVGESTGASDYDVHVGGHSQTDFDDIRFTDDSGTTTLNYFLATTTGSTPNQTAEFWVKVTDNLDSDQNVFMYYGNDTATSSSDLSNVKFYSFSPDPKQGTTTFDTCGESDINDYIDWVQIESKGPKKIHVKIKWWPEPGGYTDDGGIDLNAFHYDGETWRHIYKHLLRGDAFTSGQWYYDEFDYTLPLETATGTNYIRASLIDRHSTGDEMTGHCACPSCGTDAGVTDRHYDNDDVSFSMDKGMTSPEPSPGSAGYETAKGARIWIGYDNSTPADGATIGVSDYLLASSTVAESYQEENPSPSNPRSIPVDGQGEWDWVIKNNGAAASTNYCFRMVKSSGSLLDTYNSDGYPKLTTAAAAGGITVSGTVYQSEGGSDIGAGKSIKLKVDGLGSWAATTTSGGAYEITNITGVSAGSTITAWISGDTYKGTTVTIANDDSSNITGLDIYGGTIIVRSDKTGTALTIADMVDYDKDDDGDIHFTATTSPTTSLTVDSDSELHIWNNKEFAPGGNVTLSSGGSKGDLHIDDNATLTASGTSTISIGGSWIADSGSTFTAASSTVKFTATTTGKTITTNAQHFYDLTFDGSGGGWTFATGADHYVNNDFTITNGTVTSTNGTLQVKGSWSNSGTFNNNSGTVTFTATTTGKTITSGSSAFHILTFDGSGGGWTLGDALDVNNAFNLTNGAFIQGTTHNINWGGNVTLSSGTTFTKDSGTGKVIFDGANQTYQDNTAAGQNIGDVQIGTSPGTVNLSSNMVADSLTVESGDTLNTRGYDLDIAENITVNGTLDASDTLAGNATLINLGTNWTVASSTGNFISATSTVTFDETTASSLSSGGTTDNFDFYNLSFNKSATATTTLSNFGIKVRNDLNIASASSILDVSGSNYGITVGGSWSNSGAFVARSGTVTFNATSTGKTITSGGTSNPFYDLTFNGSGGGWTFATGDHKVSNDFTITQGTVTSTSGILYIGGSWSNSGTFNHNSGEVLFDSGTSETIADGGSPFHLITFNGVGSWLYTDGASTAPATTTVENGTATFLNAKTGNVSVTGGTLNVDWYLGVHVVDKDDTSHNIDTGDNDITISENSGTPASTVWRYNGGWGSASTTQTTGTGSDGKNPQPTSTGAIRIREYSKTSATTTYYYYNLAITSQAGFDPYNYYTDYGNKYLTSTGNSGSGHDECISASWYRITPSSMNGSPPYSGVNEPPTQGSWYIGMSSDLEFSVSSTSTDLGDLNNINDYTATGTTILYATTSYSGGYHVTAWASNDGRLRLGATDTYIPRWDYANSSPALWDNTCNGASQCGFGYTTDDNNLYNASTTEYDNRFADSTKYAGFATSTPGDRVADSTTTASGAATTITYRVSVSSTQDSGAYSGDVYYICTVNY